jgi:hypothetical protein
LLVGCGCAQIQLRVIIVALANHFDCVVTNGVEKNMQEWITTINQSITTMPSMNKIVETIDQAERMLGKTQQVVHLIGKYAHTAQHIGKQADTISHPVRYIGKQLGL